MESIFVLSPISSSRRVRTSSFTSLPAMANQNAARDGDALQAAKLSPVSIPSETVKRIRTLFPVVSRLLIEESINPISRPIMNSTTFRSENRTRKEFWVYHGFSVAVVEAVRLLDNCARFAKGSHQLSNCVPNKKKTVSTSRPKPPLIRLLRDCADSGKWARRAVEMISKTLINGPDRTESANSKTIDDIVQDFLGYEHEMDLHGNIVPFFLAPSKPSKYDVYSRRRFNENLIFEFEK